MTSHEYRLLAYLMHHTGRVVSRTELVEHLYDQDFDRDSNTIEVFVGRIRKKLDVDIIQTVRGLGYLLTPPPPGRLMAPCSFVRAWSYPKAGLAPIGSDARPCVSGIMS